MWLGFFIGAIFKATNIHNGQVVALKLQDVHHECPTNRYEKSFYPSLQGGVGMPTLWASGVEGRYDYLAIDLLGASLDSLFRKSGKNMMDLRSVCCIAMQVVSAIQLPCLVSQISTRFLLLYWFFLSLCFVFGDLRFSG